MHYQDRIEGDSPSTTIVILSEAKNLLSSAASMLSVQGILAAVQAR
jgi:hypothetical protein